LIRIAQSGLAQAKWTDHILDEMFDALQRQRPDLDSSRLDRTRELMGRAVRDWKITDYEVLIDSLKLPDPDDRHVLAAAIKAKGAGHRDCESPRLPGEGPAPLGDRSQVT
jgi:hypothetical protein